ncbi:MAG: hypothetical protein ABW073_09300 [Acidimicrobiia bacterium]
MGRIRYFFLVVWCALCGFVAAAVVGGITQLVLDTDRSWFWPASIALQLGAFVFTFAGVFSWRATHAKPRRRDQAGEPMSAAAGRVVGSWMARKR